VTRNPLESLHPATRAAAEGRLEEFKALYDPKVFEQDNSAQHPIFWAEKSGDKELTQQIQGHILKIDPGLSRFLFQTDKPKLVLEFAKILISHKKPESLIEKDPADYSPLMYLALGVCNGQPGCAEALVKIVQLIKKANLGLRSIEIEFLKQKFSSNKELMDLLNDWV
jgi:CRISPR/Cas system endoribonuclease Cas6 (RAMP superfamily)